MNIYTLFFGGFLLLGGRASDLLGRQRLFMAGLAVFTIASLVNGIATSSGMLIAGRAAQGLGAALVSPAALAIVTTTFAEGKERTRALGMWSAVAAGGGAVGRLLGGGLTEASVWRWVFFINRRSGLRLRAREPPSTTRARHSAPESADVLGATTVTAGLLVLSRHHQGAVVGLISAQTLFLRARRAPARDVRGRRVAFEGATHPAQHLPHPLTDRGERRDALRDVGLFAMFYFASIYAEILGWSPLKAGARIPAGDRRIIVGAGLAQRIRRLVRASPDDRHRARRPWARP